MILQAPFPVPFSLLRRVQGLYKPWFRSQCLDGVYNLCCLQQCSGVRAKSLNTQHVCMFICICICTNTHTEETHTTSRNTCVYIYIYTYAYKHTCACEPVRVCLILTYTHSRRPRSKPLKDILSHLRGCQSFCSRCRPSTDLAPWEVATVCVCVCPCSRQNGT